MHKPVVWSPLSENDLDQLLNYLNLEWSIQVVSTFLDELDNLITQISKNPHQFPLVHKKKRIRKCVVSKHNTLYYRESTQTIEVLRLFDTRQSPQKLNLK